MLNTGNRVCLFFFFFPSVCVSLQRPFCHSISHQPPLFFLPLPPITSHLLYLSWFIAKKKSGFPFADGCFIVQQKMPHHSSQREACQLCCCNLFLSHTLTHTFRSCYTNTSPSTTCPGQGSDRIIPGKERKEAVQFAVFWASQPGSVKKQLSLKHRRLHRESLCYFRRVFLMDDWSRLFPPFTHFLFILLLTPSSPCSLSFSYLFLPFSSFSPLSSFFHPNVFFFSFLTLLFLCVLHLHFYILCSHFFFLPPF